MAVSSADHVVLLKSVSESDNEGEDVYCEAFLSAGFQVTLVPVLDFRYVNLDQLLAKLKNHDDYAGIVFTSPRCVSGVEFSVREGNERGVLDNWKNHKNFVVGEMTAGLAETLGFVVDGRESGNSNKLAEVMSKGHYEKPFLYPKGSLTQDNFKLKLSAKNIQVDDVTVYETVPHPELETNIMKIKSQLLGKNCIFVYFSPSGIKFTLPILQKLELNLNQLKFVAIGPTTEAALVQNGLEVAMTASKPAPSALLEAVLSIKPPTS